MPNKTTSVPAHIRMALSTDSSGMDAILRAGFLNKLQKAFNNYPDFIKKRTTNKKLQQKIKKAGKYKNILHSTSTDKTLKEIFYYSHFSACCELFRGITVNLNNTQQPDINSYANNNITAGITEQQYMQWEERIHISDTIRTMEILRFMGLIDVATPSIRQLSLAAGSGSRDTDGINSLPDLKINNDTEKNTATLSFNRTPIQPDYLILIDNGEEYKEHYRELNDKHSNWLTALNLDFDIAVKQIPEILKTQNRKYINRIAGIRIDHRMIPDVPLFIKNLLPILDEETDLILSVGAGHTLDEFIGRQKVMRELHAYLSTFGLTPVLICMHNGDTPEEQRNNPSFGISGLCTYEVLYCKLIKNKLNKI